MATILIIEDNPANMKLSCLLVRKAGHTVLCAVDAETGLTLAHQDHPDLILMDVQLPGMDGLAATALLKRDPDTAAIPVIALSALAMKADEERSRTAGCDAYIVKPLRYQELYAAMDDLLAAAPSRTARDEDEPARPPRNGATPAVLIVDDEDRDRRLLEALLRPEGYVTRLAPSGAQALASIAEDPPDLIILDVRMPDMGGNEVARALKSDPATRNIPIIMVTAQNDRVARLAALDAGAEDFLAKPVDRAELWLRVRNLLRLKELNDLLVNHEAILEKEVQSRTSDLQRFRTAMDSTGDAILLVDRRTMHFVEVNATAVEMLGYSRQELLELGPLDLQPDSGEGPVTGDGDPDHEAPRTTENVRRKDGSSLPVEAHRHVQRSGDDWIIVVVLRDITEREEAGKLLEHLAHYDSLTGLPNRSQFYDTLQQTLFVASARGWTTAVLIVDVDHFKNVNDTLGHAVGDELLSEVSRRMVGCLRIGDTVSRVGGDEFAIILTMEAGAQDAPTIAMKVQDAIRKPFEFNGHQLTMTASIGIAVHPTDAADTEVLIQYADMAMHQAKEAGRDAIRFFTAQMNADALARLELEIALRRAVKNGEFVLHYQPQVRLETGKIAGLEALLRWERPGHGLVPPNKFIPVLEASGLIVEVGSWVISAVCEQIGRWRRSAIGPVQVSVNVAARQLLEGDLAGDVTRALNEHDIPPHLLELELTESTLMANTDQTITILHSLRSQGVGISIDDFGTGYSSLAYLRRFPIDKLKIDISFIREITSNPDDAAISLAIIRMAHSLNLAVVAEGVETAAQLSYLRRHRCDQMQGYFFSRPLAVPALEQLLAAGAGLPTGETEAEPSPATLLLVDDDPRVVEALRLLLADDGYRILTAMSADEGFEVLALNQVHVIMCDERMPGMSGTDFLARVKEMHPDTLRIVLSGCADDGALIGSINRGEVYRYFTKPWDAAKLRDSMREALRHYWQLHDARTGWRTADERHDRQLAVLPARRPQRAGSRSS